MKTIVKEATFKNRPMFQIWKDEEDQERPLLSMGMLKIKLLIRHLEEAKAFIEEHDL